MTTIAAASLVLTGMILMGLIVWFTMPALMLVKRKSNRNYDDTIAALTEALKNKQDWMVKAVNDYQKALQVSPPLNELAA